MADRLAALAVGDRQLELCLQIQPELRVYAEPVAEAERGGARDRALASA